MVSQVACFSSNPCQSHAAAVKAIMHYLAGTIKQGTIATQYSYKLDCYVDASFSGLHGREPQDMMMSTCSQTGYDIFFCEHPYVEKSAPN